MSEVCKYKNEMLAIPGHPVIAARYNDFLVVYGLCCPDCSLKALDPYLQGLGFTNADIPVYKDELFVVLREEPFNAQQAKAAIGKFKRQMKYCDRCSEGALTAHLQGGEE